MGFIRGTTIGLGGVLAFGLGSAAMAQDDLVTVLAGLGAAECADSSLTCVTLPMPRDHRGNDPDATIDITFAVSLAGVESLGVLIYAVGGPGSSGLAVAEGYLAGPTRSPSAATTAARSASALAQTGPTSPLPIVHSGPVWS